MTGKKSFILYADIIQVVDELPRDVKGDLFQLILDYVNDRNPEPTDLLLKVIFLPIKNQLKRDLQEWVKTIERNKINGEKGGRPQNPTKPKEPTGLSGLIKKPKEPTGLKNNPLKPDTDTDTGIGIDNVTVTDTVTVSGIETQKKFPANVYEFLKDNFLNTNTNWLSTIAINNYLSPNQVKSHLSDFIKQIEEQEKFKTVNNLQIIEDEFKKHFPLWLRRKKEIEKTQNNGFKKPQKSFEELNKMIDDGLI